MAIIERDVVHFTKEKNGDINIDLPVTRLGLVEDTADVKAALAAADYLPLIDSADNGQMKKILASVLMEAIKSGITLESLGAAASTHNHDAGNVTSGTFAAARIPGLDASKIASGTFDAARIPGLDAGKLTSGILPIARGGTGNANGLAATATKLATARTIRTNLGSTAAPSFDGSANVTPGVTGILPVANGGTGVATLAALAAALQSGGGMCKIQTGSYVGTGTYGSDSPCSLTFDFVPRLVAILGPSASMDGVANGMPVSDIAFFACAPLKTSYANYGYVSYDTASANGGSSAYAMLTGNTLKWYSASARFQMNAKATNYFIALG